MRAIGFLLVLRLAALGAMTGDIVTTQQVLSDGGTESNPLIGGQPTIGKLIALDAGTAGAIYALEKHHPRIAKVLYVTVIATRGWATVHNRQQR